MDILSGNNAKEIRREDIIDGFLAAGNIFKNLLPSSVKNTVAASIIAVLASTQPAHSQSEQINFMTGCELLGDTDGFPSIICNEDTDQIEPVLGVYDFNEYYSRESLNTIYNGDIGLADEMEKDLAFQSYILPVIRDIYESSGITMRDDAMIELYSLYRLKNSSDRVEWVILAVNIVDLYTSIPNLESILIKYDLYPTENSI